MNNSIVIRQATQSDIPALVGLLQQLFGIEQDFEPDPEKQRAGLTQLLDAPQAGVFVAESNGRILGMLTVQILISTAEGGRVGQVEDVVVDQGDRGRGIGRAMLSHLRQWSMEQGLSRLQLLADRDNGLALDFYRKQGWATTDLIGLRLLIPG
jgi:ribosomal protein S18 acetylase RimI-like enzyme